jgi:hypothetical protein
MSVQKQNSRHLFRDSRSLAGVIGAVGYAGFVSAVRDVRDEETADEEGTPADESTL